MKISKILNNDREKHTFILLLIGSIFNGISLGIILLQEFILRKSLYATLFEITILVMVQPISNIFSIFYHSFSKYFKSRNDLFLLIGFLGKLILLLFLFINSSIFFLFVISIFYIFNTFMNPLFSNIMQLNFTSKNRGVVYGIISSISIFFTLLTSNITGRLLDYSDSLYKILFALSGIFGFFCCLTYSKIKIRKKKQNKIQTSNPLKIVSKILKQDKKFKEYEIFFFLYGMGYLIVLPAIPVYFVDTLKLDYSKISFIKGFIGQIGYIIFSPITGFFLDRINIFLYSSITFLLLSFYPFLLFVANLTTDPLPFIYTSFLFFSISMSAVSTIWDLSSIHFARENDSSQYQNIHIFLTGIRGVITPILGYFILRLTSPKIVFLVSTSLFLISSIGMSRLFDEYKDS